jgi:hypothetical protein
MRRIGLQLTPYATVTMLKSLRVVAESAAEGKALLCCDDELSCELSESLRDLLLDGALGAGAGAVPCLARATLTCGCIKCQTQQIYCAATRLEVAARRPGRKLACSCLMCCLS